MSEGPETDVDSLVTGLVREFLYRRGLTAILQTFDAETGYSHGDALSSTRELVEALRLSTLYKRNASSGACSTLCSSAPFQFFHRPSLASELCVQSAAQTHHSRVFSRFSRPTSIDARGPPILMRPL